MRCEGIGKLILIYHIDGWYITQILIIMMPRIMTMDQARFDAIDSPTIIENRCNFEKEHKLKKNIHSKNKWQRHIGHNHNWLLGNYDHNEWYETTDHYIIHVISFYGLREDVLNDRLFGEPFISTPPVYLEYTHSYYKKFPKSTSVSCKKCCLCSAK